MRLLKHAQKNLYLASTATDNCSVSPCLLKSLWYASGLRSSGASYRTDQRRSTRSMRLSDSFQRRHRNRDEEDGRSVGHWQRAHPSAVTRSRYDV